MILSRNPQNTQLLALRSTFGVSLRSTVLPVLPVPVHNITLGCPSQMHIGNGITRTLGNLETLAELMSRPTRAGVCLVDDETLLVPAF